MVCVRGWSRVSRLYAYSSCECSSAALGAECACGLHAVLGTLAYCFGYVTTRDGIWQKAGACYSPSAAYSAGSRYDFACGVCVCPAECISSFEHVRQLQETLAGCDEQVFFAHSAAVCEKPLSTGLVGPLRHVPNLPVSSCK